MSFLPQQPEILSWGRRRSFNVESRENSCWGARPVRPTPWRHVETVAISLQALIACRRMDRASSYSPVACQTMSDYVKLVARSCKSFRNTLEIAIPCLAACPNARRDPLVGQVCKAVFILSAVKFSKCQHGEGYKYVYPCQLLCRWRDTWARTRLAKPCGICTRTHGHARVGIYIYIYIFIYAFIYLFIHLFIYSFIYLLVYLFIYSFIHLCIHLFIYLFTCLFIYSFIHLSIYIFIHLFIYIFIHYSFIYLFIYSFIYSFIHLFIYLFVYLLLYIIIYIYIYSCVHICI